MEHFGPAFFHFHVDAPLVVRRKRYEQVGRPGTEFDHAVLHHVEQAVPALRAHADEVVVNDARLNDFERIVGRAITNRFGGRRALCLLPSS